VSREYVNSKNSSGVQFFPENFEISTLFKAGLNEMKFCALRKGEANQTASCKAVPETLAR
jgi:hypothetical protein